MGSCSPADLLHGEGVQGQEVPFCPDLAHPVGSAKSKGRLCLVDGVVLARQRHSLSGSHPSEWETASGLGWP